MMIAAGASSCLTGPGRNRPTPFDFAEIYPEFPIFLAEIYEMITIVSIRKYARN